MTRDEFIDGYMRRSKLPPEWRTPDGYELEPGWRKRAVPCECGESVCEGWAMETAEGPVLRKFATVDLTKDVTPDPCARLPEIADRLGVPPMPADASPAMIEFSTRDGRRYDFFGLVIALLDRMDEVHRGFGPR